MHRCCFICGSRVCCALAVILRLPRSGTLEHVEYAAVSETKESLLEFAKERNKTMLQRIQNAWPQDEELAIAMIVQLSKAVHQAALDKTGHSVEAASQYEEETVAALKAEIQSLDEASEGRQQQSAALAQAFGRDIGRFAELEEIVALQRQMSLSPSSP